MLKQDDAIPDLDPFENAWTARVQRIEKLAELLDSKFTLPGTTIKFGWDALIGFIPVAGDTLTLLPQCYFLYEVLRMKVGWRVVARMLLNVVIDWLIGSIPLLGDLFDVAFKSNLMNAKLVAEAMRQKRVNFS